MIDSIIATIEELSRLEAASQATWDEATDNWHKELETKHVPPHRAARACKDRLMGMAPQTKEEALALLEYVARKSPSYARTIRAAVEALK